MAEIVQNLDGGYGERFLTLAEYAEKVGVSTRTIKRWLGADEVPGAYRDEYAGGQWRIPENASRVIRATSAEQTHPQDHSQAPLSLVQGVGGPGGQMVPFGALEAPEPSLREDLDDEPGYLDIPTAARYLGIPQAQIRSNPDRFGLEDVGVNGSMRVPQRIVRRIMGY